jgi:putative oxidoreductase
MSIFEPARPPWPSRMLSVLRIVAGLLFVMHGTQKLFGFPPLPPGAAMPPFGLLSVLGVASILEVFGGLAIVLGVFTRPIAFLLAGEMAVAYFTVHFPQSFFPASNGGDPAVLFCFIFLYFAFAGGGEWSIDAMIARRKRNNPSLSG